MRKPLAWAVVLVLGVVGVIVGPAVAVGVAVGPVDPYSTVMFQ